MNIDLLKLEKIKARKEKNQVKVDALSSVINEVEMTELRNKKSLNDVEILNSIKKVISQLKETLDYATKGNRKEVAVDCLGKIAALESFLPKQLSDVELEAEVQDVVVLSGATSIKDMGKVMAELKNKLGASIDMNKVSALVKTKLNK